MVGNDYWKDVVDPGDRVSKLAKEVNLLSYQNCPALEILPVQPDNFRGPVDYLWKQHILEEMIKRKVRERIENDGAGGKPQFFSIIAEDENIRKLFWELIAMTADDIARSGAFPCAMINQVDFLGVTDKNFHLVEAAFMGYGDALAKMGLVNITGETAIMKHSITCFMTGDLSNTVVLTMSGACLGLSRPDLYLDPARVKPGMPIVGFHEKGYRCNGGGSYTNLIIKKWGTDIEEIRNNPEAMKFIRALTAPSISYAKTLTRINGWNPDGSVGERMANIVMAAHITGGGVWSKLGEVLPKHVRAVLHTMPSPPPVLLEAQEIGKEIGVPLSDWEAYGLNGGCGMLLATGDKKDAAIVIKEAEKDGVTASVVGRIEERAWGYGPVSITSQFSEKGRALNSDEPF